MEAAVNDHIGSLHRALDPSNASGVVKSALRCLAAMASAGPGCSRALLHSLDFSEARWRTLARRRNPADPEDTRHCCVQLGVAFLVGGPPRLFLERAPDLASLMLDSLAEDKPATLLLLLPVLLDRLLSPSGTGSASSGGVSKTQKARLFGRRQLASLASLLAYAGQQQRRRYRGKRRSTFDDESNEAADHLDDGDHEGGGDIEVVRDTAQRLLRRLGTSARVGILFPRGGNPLLTHLLLACLAPRLAASVRCRRLIVDIGRACPELAARVSEEVLAPLLPPRATVGWLAAADCLAGLWSLDRGDGEGGEEVEERKEDQGEEDHGEEAAKAALAAVMRDAAVAMGTEGADVVAALTQLKVGSLRG